MTLLGKIFTGILFVLSVLFFAIAVAVNSTHINQKAEAEKFKSQAESVRRDNEQLQSLLENVKRELAIEQMARRSALAALQTQISAMEQELTSKESELRELLGAHTTKVAEAKTISDQLSAQTSANNQLRDQIRDTREDRNSLTARLVEAKHQVNELQGKYQALVERAAQLRLENNLVTQKLQTLGIKPDTMLDAPPAVQGEVLAVSDGLVEVSLGRDDGIREGFTLEVHRAGQYLGRLKVRRVDDDKSVAEVLTGFQKGFIQAGDRVNSKLF